MSLIFSKSDQIFCPELLNNSYGFKSYIRGEPALKELKDLAKNPAELQKISKNHPYYSKCNILVICLKYPSNFLISSVCSTIAFVLNSIWLKHYAAFFEVAAIHMTRQWEQVTDQWATKSRMIVPALHAPKIDAIDVYMRPSIPTRSIDDPTMQALTFKHAALQEAMDHALDHFYASDESHDDLERIASEKAAFKDAYIQNPQQAILQLKEIYREEPFKKPIETLYETLLCHSDMMNGSKPFRLYQRRGCDLNTPLYVNVLRNHNFVKGLNKIRLYQKRNICRGGSEWFIHLFLKSDRFFREPKQHIIAVAKQFENGISGQGLVLQALVDCSGFLDQEVTGQQEHTVSTFDLDQDHASALKKINSLAPGVYRVGVFRHSLVHVKLPSGESYTWDVNLGLHAHNSKTFLDFVLEHYYVREHPDSHIFFERHDPITHF